MPGEKDAYDAVAYPSFPYPNTHPDRLAVMAILHGLSPAPVEQCRVLEIACNEGANLIPMAYAIPRSEFVGFDLAHLPIERGHERIRELGLTNVRIFQSDLLNVGMELGQFNYIVAHGLYAWVPEPVSDRLLALCSKLLAPHGVAFVSYNALPGGHLRNMIRDMMLHSVKDIEDPEQKAASALAFLRLILEARPQGDAFRLLIEEQLKQMQKRSPQAIFHDEMSAVHHPLHFADFVAHARRHGLEYLSEAVLPPPPDPCYRSDLRPTLESAVGDDIIAQEQVLDFMRMRMYRETLLCHTEREIARDFPAGALRQLFFASQAMSTPGEAPDAKVFTLPGGIRMETAHPATIALMEQLEAAWPRALSFAEIEPSLAERGVVLDSEGATLLMRLAVAKMIELRAWRAPVAREISARPSVSASSRQEARTRPHATTLLHTTLRLDDPMVRSFLTLLDGTRDRAALLDALKAEFPAMPTEQLEQGIEPNLRLLHRAGILEA
ncbi:MAG TPA: class I SAM-dependent methyltransferase [Silvibacterium sp.]|nr:class I SAM-dependent methyltransferase [Silvibacterium sp.]